MDVIGPGPGDPHGIAPGAWLNREKLALLVIDMQNYMTDRRYSGRWSADGADDYYFDRYEKTVLPNIGRLTACFRSLGIGVVYLRIAHMNANFLDIPAGLTRKRLKEDLFDSEGNPYTLMFDSPASQIDPRLGPAPGELVICKTSSGGFCTSDLDLVLRSNGVSCLVFTGGLTEACVESTLREAFDRGYHCTLAEDACISSRRTAHEASVETLGRYFGWVTETGEIIRILSGG